MYFLFVVVLMFHPSSKPSFLNFKKDGLELGWLKHSLLPVLILKNVTVRHNYEVNGRQ